jgi:hypothetical protein
VSEVDVDVDVYSLIYRSKRNIFPNPVLS